MGYKQGSILLLVVALTLLAGVAQGQGLNAVLSKIQISGLNVSGVLNCPPSAPGLGLGAALSNVTVSLRCNNVLGVTTLVSQTVTNLNGIYNFIVPQLRYPLVTAAGVVPCTVSVALPLNTTVCPILNTVTGTLNSFVVLVGLVFNDALGLIASVVGSAFLGLI